MAIQAGNFGSVPGTIIDVLVNNLGMAFHAISDLQYRICSLAIAGSNTKTQGQNKGCCENDFLHTFPLLSSSCVLK